VIDEVRSGLDEKTVKSIAKATAATEVAKLHNIIMEEFNEFKAKVEEEVSKRGVDVEVIRRLVDEVRNSLLGELDKRVLHLVDMINEQSNSIKDVLDLVNEVLKLETSFEEELGRLRSEIRKHLSEEGLEEMIYRTMIRRGIIRKKHRRWVLLAVGLGISAAIIAGFIINPVVTFITVAMAIVILLRW
jgi:hypothetical protein